MRKLASYLLAITLIWAFSAGAWAINDFAYGAYDRNLGDEAQLDLDNYYTVHHMIGDNDGYGYGHDIVPDGIDLPFTSTPEGSPYGWLFDNRSAEEMAAINGAQATDISTTFDATFHHEFNISQFDYLTEAVFTIDVSGVQPNYFGPEGYTRLYLDGMEVTEFTMMDNQGAWGSDLFTFDVNLEMLLDGELDVFIDVFEHWDEQYRSVDEIAVDFTRLSVTGVRNAIPEPATLFLFGLGLAGYAVRRKIN